MNRSQPDPTPSDEALVAAYRAGDRSALGVLWTRHGGALVGYATRMLQVREEAEEVAQDAILTVLSGRWRSGSSVRGWLFTVVHRACIDKIRRRKRWRGVQQMLGWTPPSTQAPDARLAQSQRTSALERAVAQLPESHRAVVLLYYGQELSSQEVSEATGLTDQQVRSQLSYARRKLRELLEAAP